MRNVLPFTLIILAIGLFFTFTAGKIQQIKSIQAQNSAYLVAINNSQELISERDKVLAAYNGLNVTDRTNLDKIIPDNIDNVRRLIDIKNIASRHGINLQGLSTSADGATSKSTTAASAGGGNKLNPVGVTLSFSASYPVFLSFLRDLESSLRILDITSMTVTANDTGIYSYSIGMNTYWLSK